jgi:hypothetical protein
MSAGAARCRVHKDHIYWIVRAIMRRMAPCILCPNNPQRNRWATCFLDATMSAGQNIQRRERRGCISCCDSISLGLASLSYYLVMLVPVLLWRLTYTLEITREVSHYELDVKKACRRLREYLFRWMCLLLSIHVWTRKDIVGRCASQAKMKTRGGDDTYLYRAQIICSAQSVDDRFSRFFRRRVCGPAGMSGAWLHHGLLIN